jgi:hypothetical protein
LSLPESFSSEEPKAAWQGRPEAPRFRPSGGFVGPSLLAHCRGGSAAHHLTLHDSGLSSPLLHLGLFPILEP